MIETGDREALIRYRIDQAFNTIAEVDKLIESDLLTIAVNRMYYGIFYCLIAVALKYEFKSSKHLQLIGWFNQNFIKTGLIDLKYGRILRDAFKNRSDGDYVPYISFKEIDVVKMRNEMEDFIRTISSFMQNYQKQIKLNL
jgi:uncharacterized protein (UPF0332 family)